MSIAVAHLAAKLRPIPKIAVTAAACVLLSCLRPTLAYTALAELVLASPASAVALLGLCVFPFGLAAFQSSSGTLSKAKHAQKEQESICSSSSSSGSKDAKHEQPTGNSCSQVGQPKQQDSSQNCDSSAPFKLAQPPFPADLSITLAAGSHVLSGRSRLRRRRLPRLCVELTPLPRLSLDFSGSKHSSSRCSSIAGSSNRSSLDGCCHLFQSDTTALMISSSRWAPSMSRIASGRDLQQLDSSMQPAAVGAAGFAGQHEFNDSDRRQCQQQQLPLPTFAVGEATQSVGLSLLPEALSALGDVITETHLLQVGAVLGEASARGALAAQEAGGPVGHPSSFYGSADTDDHLEPWELLVSEGNGKVLYWGWRRPLRKGLFMYMTRSVFLDASPAELRAFMNDDAYRVVWDSAVTVLRPLVNAATVSAGASRTSHSSSGSGSCGSTATSSSGSSTNAAIEAMAAATAARVSGSGDGSSNGVDGSQQAAQLSVSSEHLLEQQDRDSTAAAAAANSASSTDAAVLPHETAFMQAMVQFPKPMASRSYVYARRVWPRPIDGGCYCLSKSCIAPPGVPAPSLPGRSVSVEDYCSGCVIKAPSPELLPASALNGPAAEVFMVYFEDSRVRPGLANLGIKKGLWPLVQRTEKALRVYQAGAAANIHLQPAGVSAADSSSSGSNAAAGSSPSPQPGPGSISRSVSLGGGAQPRQQGAAAVALSRMASLQEGGSRDDAASLPCFPLLAGTGLEDGLVEDVTDHDGSNDTNCDDRCSSKASSSSSSVQHASTCGSHNKLPAVAQAKVVSASTTSDCRAAVGNGKQSQQKSTGSRWGWLSSIGSRFMGAMKQSGQLLAALWKTQGQLAVLVPRLEWHMLCCMFARLRSSGQLMLGPPAAAPAVASGSSASSSSRAGRLSRLSSHPLPDWVQTGMAGASKLASHMVLRLPSHPLSLEDVLQGDSPTAAASGEAHAAGMCCHRTHAAAVACPAAMSSADGSASCNSSLCGSNASVPSSSGYSRSTCSSHSIGDAGSEVASYSISNASCCGASGCCCCCAGSCSGSASYSSRGSAAGQYRAGSTSSSSSSKVHDTTGGRRQRRVAVRLLQVAGMRVAGKLASVLEQPRRSALEPNW